MKKILVVLLCCLMLASCAKKEVYKGVESDIKVDRIKNMGDDNKYSNKLKDSEFIKTLDGESIYVLKENKGYVYNSKSDMLTDVEKGYEPYDMNASEILLYKVNDSYFKELIVKDKNKSRMINFEEHISDAKLSKDKVYAVKIMDNSSMKFFKGQIFEEKEGKLVDTGKVGKLLKSNDTIIYCTVNDNKFIVKDMEDKDVFSNKLDENKVPIDAVMHGKDVIYSVFDSKNKEVNLYMNDKIILKSKAEGYEEKLKDFKLSDNYLTWLDNKLVYNLKDNKFMYFENGNDDMMLVPVGKDLYGLKIKNSIGVFDDNSVRFK